MFSVELLGNQLRLLSNGQVLFSANYFLILLGIFCIVNYIIAFCKIRPKINNLWYNEKTYIKKYRCEYSRFGEFIKSRYQGVAINKIVSLILVLTFAPISLSIYQVIYQVSKLLKFIFVGKKRNYYK